MTITNANASGTLARVHTLIQDAPLQFSMPQLQAIKDIVGPTLTPDEFTLFVMTCARKRLDPILKQVYAIKRFSARIGKEVMTIQTGIDGYRAIAHRTGRYEGQDGPYWCGQDGKWTDCWSKKEPPFAAKVGIRIKDQPEPTYHVAHWSEYADDKSPMWRDMGCNQLAKCAEAGALRKAFPEETGNLLVDAEVGGDDNEPRVKRVASVSASSILDSVNPSKPKPEETGNTHTVPAREEGGTTRTDEQPPAPGSESLDEWYIRMDEIAQLEGWDVVDFDNASRAMRESKGFKLPSDVDAAYRAGFEKALVGGTLKTWWEKKNKPK